MHRAFNACYVLLLLSRGQNISLAPGRLPSRASTAVGLSGLKIARNDVLVGDCVERSFCRGSRV